MNTSPGSPPSRSFLRGRFFLWVSILSWIVVLVLGIRLQAAQRRDARTRVQLFAARQEIARLRLLEQAVSELESRHRELVAMLQRTETEGEPLGTAESSMGPFLRDQDIAAVPKIEDEEWEVDLEPQRLEPHLWPSVGWVTQEFRRPSEAIGRPHYGVDIAAREGSPVVAPANGIVMQVYWDQRLGRVLEIQHGSGHLTRYGHLQRVEVQPGEAVEVGEIVARLGDSGESSAPHLHYELELLGETLDPSPFLPDYRSVVARGFRDTVAAP